jgi:Mrp family chromosome partitioning ATPase/capsular polysaccharide biosynthesis protein
MTQVVYSAREAEAVDKALEGATSAGLPQNISGDALTLHTSAFAERVSQAMGGTIAPAALRSAITTTTDDVVKVIYIQATGSDAGLAEQIANGFAGEFVRTRQEEIQGLLQSALRFVQDRIGSLTAEETTSDIGLELKQQRDTLSLLLSSEVADYEILERATAPSSPYYPRPLSNLLWGVIGGLILGLILTFVLASLDRRIKDQAALERIMDLPILGTMPMASRQKTSKPSRGAAVGFRRGNEPLLESMRMLRSNLKVLGFGDTRRSVLITSTVRGEGKSTLAVNLTLAMALAGDRVILVDADLRNPAIDRYLGLPKHEGLGDSLADTSVSWSERIQAVALDPFVDPKLLSTKRVTEDETAVSKFLCLASGTLPANPTEMLESPAMADLLAELQGISDYVIIDGPPMLLASDSLILAQCVDAVVLASTLGRETAAEAKQVKQLLARAEIQALGLVICGARAKSHDSYYYRSGHDRPASVHRGRH